MLVIIVHSGNSLVNLIVYIFKMPIFRAVIRKFIRKWENSASLINALLLSATSYLIGLRHLF